MTPSVFLRCDAGREDGLGHLSRCLVLADALSESGQAGNFLIHAPETIRTAWVEARGHVGRAAPDYAGTTGDLAFVRDVMTGQAVRPLLVVDSRRVAADYTAACGELAFVVCLDDESLRDLSCDILVNNHAWVSEASYPARPGRRVLAGARYNLIREDFFVEDKAAAADLGPLRILITLGGEDPGNHTAWIVEELGDLLLRHQVTVVVGPAHPAPESVRACVGERLPEARLLQDPDSMVPLITAADLAITAGGTTCYELAAARVAQAAIVIEDHQEPLVASLEARGCLMRLGHHRDLSPARARETLSTLLRSAALRRRLQQAAAALLPAPGAARISAAVREAYLEAA